VSAGPPPWGAREPEPERTPDGREIVATRFGPHYREDGRLYPYYVPAEEMAMTLEPMMRRRRGEPVVVPSDWSPF
jgi:hypothetical protein